MILGEDRLITLKLGTGSLAHQASAAIEALNKNQGGQTDVADIAVAPLMRAELSGDGFAIKPEGPWDQWISGKKLTTWEWTVKALDGDDLFPSFSAKRELRLTISAVLKIQGSEHPRTIEPVLHRSIIVEIRWSGWLHKFVESATDLWWIWTTAAAIAAGVIAWFHRKKAHPTPADT
jgi:hypothetical protein